MSVTIRCDRCNLSAKMPIARHAICWTASLPEGWETLWHEKHEYTDLCQSCSEAVLEFAKLPPKMT